MRVYISVDMEGIGYLLDVDGATATHKDDGATVEVPERETAALIG